MKRNRKQRSAPAANVGPKIPLAAKLRRFEPLGSAAQTASHTIGVQIVAARDKGAAIRKDPALIDAYHAELLNEPKALKS